MDNTRIFGDGWMDKVVRGNARVSGGAIPRAGWKEFVLIPMSPTYITTERGFGALLELLKDY